MELSFFGEQIDKIITLDLAFRKVIDVLYSAAREKAGEPLAMRAAKELKQILQPHDTVFIATGWPDRPHISPEIAETDGPPGAALLGRALHRAFLIVPLFLVEENLVRPMERVVQAAGFKILPPDQSIAAAHSSAPIHGASVLDFPKSSETARERAITLIQRYKPAAIISIEKGGMNEKGIIHTSRGHDTTEYMAKVDFLIEEGKKSGALTIGIGDGGNEIGMGIIREDIMRLIPYGKQCNCPCRSSIAPITKTHLLITATVSNWGAYGLAASLAILSKNQTVFHDYLLEKWVLEHASDAGFIDGITGFVEPGADGLPAEVHCHIVSLLSEVVRKGCLKES